MKNILLGVLREVGIALVILVVCAGVIAFAFKDQLPYDEVIPSGEEYVKANMKTYSVSSTERLAEINQITITHEANSGQIIAAENEVRIQTGKYTPFGTINSLTDIPTERVGISVPISASRSGDNSYSTSNSEGMTENEEKLEYPAVTDDSIKKIEAEQSESNESAASRRFNTSD